MDIFTRTIHGIRLKYAAVSVVFLAIAVVLFYLGGPRAFGWFDVFAVLTLVIMVVTLFLLQCHYTIGPIEKMSELANRQLAKTLDAADPVRIPWSGKGEFACLAASLNGLLEAVQSRSLGLAEENHRLKTVIASAEVELVVMNASGMLLDIVHCPPEMEPVPGLLRGAPPDPAVWSEASRGVLRSALAAARDGRDAPPATLTFGSGSGNRTRRIKMFVRRTDAKGFPIVVFREDHDGPGAVLSPVRKVPLSRIAAGVSRDLKNVFSVIGNLAERYANSEEPEVRETVTTINEAIRNGNVMMDQLLLLGGETPMDLKAVTVRSLMDATKTVVDELTRRNGVRVDYDIAAEERRLMVDVGQFRRVVEILVRNSVEAFGVVPGRIAVSARGVELSDEEGAVFSPPQDHGRGIVFRFEDDGSGMPADILAHVFEPYCSTKSSGRGLGLAVANSIIEAHGGGMRVDSEKGVRTAVEIFLRFSNRASEDVEQIRREFPGGEVLVVDDNRSVLRITAALLRTQRIAAHVAENRVDAIRKFGELSGRIRAVFLDAQLGETTSVGVLRNMREIDGQVPVFVVSGYTKEEIDAMFAEAPPDGFLMKPYTVNELQALLSAFPPAK